LPTVINFHPDSKQLNPFDGMHLGQPAEFSSGLAVPLLCILVIGLMARNIAGAGCLMGSGYYRRFLSWLSL